MGAAPFGDAPTGEAQARRHHPIPRVVVRGLRRLRQLTGRRRPYGSRAAAGYAGMAVTWGWPVTGTLEAGEARCRGVMEPPVRVSVRLFGSEKSLARRAERLLAELGTSSDAVARSLLVMGAHGEIGDPSAGPLALYLSAVIGAEPKVESVAVDTEVVTIVRRSRLRPGVSVALPPAAGRFVRAFDAGCYPWLQRKGAQR